MTAQDMGMAGQLHCLFNCFELSIKRLAFQTPRERRT
jgi:hypothetical protein